MKDRWSNPNTLLGDLVTVATLTGLGGYGVYKGSRAIGNLIQNSNLLKNLGAGALQLIPERDEFCKNKGGSANSKPELHNVAEYERYKKVLRTTEQANDLVDSLRKTGKLPSNYVTKSQAQAAGWRSGKALNNYIPNAQLGGDIFQNTTGILPNSPGRILYEADIGLSSSISRAKQPGTRLVYSNDGLLNITYDHYNTVHSIGCW